ncbi:hypothetical protein NOVOSPHI9U_200021 [Novosphingobium sp. 9U]|nr:hypothetical protein NOVOSPHI9U_200021 [Novosphingobium sp. 9U]
MAAVKGRLTSSSSGREHWDLRKTLTKPAVPARVQYGLWEGALHPGSMGPIYRKMIQEAFARGVLPDLTADDLTQLLKGISAHSTRVGSTTTYSRAGKDIAAALEVAAHAARVQPKSRRRAGRGGKVDGETGLISCSRGEESERALLPCSDPN